MARIMTFIVPGLALWLVTLSRASGAAPSGSLAELPDSQALSAYKTYWDSFSSYEAQRLEDGEAKFNQAWQKIQQDYAREDKKITEEKLATLTKAAQKYRAHLERFPDSSNRSYVLLNLAQILAMMADQKDLLSDDGMVDGDDLREEATSLLDNIEKDDPGFEGRDQALYLKAILLEADDESSKAESTWAELARRSTESRYSLYANTALGDYAFKEGRSGDAMGHYGNALKTLTKGGIKDSDWDRVRLHYRYIWAAYRAGDVDQVIEKGLELLSSDQRLVKESQRQRLEADATDLMGDSLYEKNQTSLIKTTLARKDLTKFAARIGYRTVRRYFGDNHFGDAASLGEWLATEYPLAPESPLILQTVADSYRKLGKPADRLSTLEKIAVMLPAQSLWRAHHRDDPETLRAMEDLAKNATIFAATAHYEQGISSGSSSAFKTAAAYFGHLLALEPRGPQSNMWRLREAHCQYFLGRYEQSSHLYEKLKSDHKVSGEILQLAAFQSVQAAERIFRDKYAKASESGEDPRKKISVLSALSDLEKKIDDFALRFPGQNRGIELLLVGANANRDMDRLDPATKLWQRVLIMEPSDTQRRTALRGLVYASIKEGSPGPLLETTRRILRTENPSILGVALTNEILAVLATATKDEAKRLNENGQVLEAGVLQTEIAQEFRNLPNRDQMFRDGAYLQAIAGEWGRAEAASLAYFKAGLTKERADMTYLLARSHEYQLRLHPAAVQYLELAEKYPSHSRAKTSLERAEKLALAEGDYLLAARAAEVRGGMSPENSERSSAFARSVAHLEKAGDPQRALALARRRLRNARSEFERLSSRLMIGRLTYVTGSESDAIEDMTNSVKQIEKSRGNLSSGEYAALAGEGYVWLGNEAKRQFDDFDVVERGGSLDDNIAVKTKYLENLVLSYDKAAARGSPTFGAEARFKIGSSAATLATEIAGALSREQGKMTFKSKNRYSAAISRLKAMAKKYLSTNILLARKFPANLKDNEWIRKSQAHLAIDLENIETPSYNEDMPIAFAENQILEWSL